MKRLSISMTLILVGVYIFLITPILIIVVISFNSASYLSFPPEGFSFRWYASFFSSGTFLNSLYLSLYVAIITSIISVFIATPAALYYVNYLTSAREKFRIAIISPMLLPEVLTSIALLFFFNNFMAGISNAWPLVIGHVVITTPLVFLIVTSSLFNMPPSINEAAATLGAGAYTSFKYITFPIIKSGIVTGGMLSFIISFDNVNISILLKPIGNNPLPIQLYDYIRYDFDPTAAAASTISITLTLGIVLMIDRLYGLKTVRF